MDRTPARSRRVPGKALLLSLLSLSVPVVSSALFPGWTSGDAGVLLWLPALVPGFLLSYYRGWRGASMALAAGMAALALAQVAVLLTGAATPNTTLLLGIVSVLTVVSLGSGVLSQFLHRDLDRAERLALTDVGTGIPNRRHAALELEKSFAAAQRGAKLSVVLFDLDRFKDVNDRYGHAEGDRVLRGFAEILRASTRAMHVTARFGGEEFVAVLRDIDAQGAHIFADRIRVRMKESEILPTPVTVSGGVAQYEEGMAAPDVLLAAADQALYYAKTSGRDQVVVVSRKGRKDGEMEPELPARAEAAGGAGELILVVDDDVDALRSVAKSLRRFGYTVLESPSPARAVEIVRGLDEPVELILTDIVMPEMGGFRLVEMLSEIQEEVRVIYMSGYSQVDVDWEGVPGTSYDYLSKPISIHTLARRVRRLLDQPASTGKRPVATRVIPSEGPGAAGSEPDATATDLASRAGVEARILLIPGENGDEEKVAAALRAASGATVQVAENPATVLDRLSHLHVELLVLDLDRSGEELEDLIRVLENRQTSSPGILLLVGKRNLHIRDRCAGLSLMDCVRKPVDVAELRTRVRTLLRLRSYERWIGTVEEQVRSRVAARTAELEEAREEVLRRLAWAAEFRDDLTGRHAERVGVLSGLIARELGWSAVRRTVLEKAAPLHDLGKIAIPDALLRKSDELTPNEQAIMQRHTAIGAKLLAGSRNPILRVAEQIALTHHERWDGRGYPRGLSGEEIAEEGRIVALADAYDSLTSSRPYRDGVEGERAMEEIRAHRGTQFDPRMVDALDRLVRAGGLEEAVNQTMVALPDLT
jgi:putative two-component system response regulator